MTSTSVAAKSSSSPTQDVDEIITNEDVDHVNDNSDGEDDQDMLLQQFLEYCEDTPLGGMEVGDADLLRGVMTSLITSSSSLGESSSDVPSGHSNAKTAAKPVDSAMEPAIMVESLLFRLLKEWDVAVRADDETIRERAFRPTRKVFDRAIMAWYKSDNPDRVVRVLSLLSDQREIALRHDNADDLVDVVGPSLHTIKLVLRTLAQSKERGLDKRARMVFNSLQQDYNIEPDAETYGLLVQIVARSRTRGAAQRAEALLREAVTKFPNPTTEPSSGGGLDANVFNTVVTAYAKGGDEDGPKRAQDLIVFMDQLDASCGNLGIYSPNSNTFTSLIDAYAQTNEWDSVREAERILNRLLDQYLNGDDERSKNLEPNVATWTIVISAWARLSKKNRNGAAQRAGNLLRRMEDLYLQGKISFQPDAITYITCMNAFAYSKYPSDVTEAERLLDEMNEFWLDGNDKMKPSPRSVKVLIDSWIKVENMENAKDVLEKYESMVDDDPTVGSDWWGDVYHAFLLGYAKQDDPRRATVYLNLMIEEEGMEPDSICYDKIIEAYTRVGNEVDGAKKAQEIFELMEQRRQIGAVVPNERIYTSFIRALTKGRVPNLHKKAELLLVRMRTLYEDGNRQAQPTIFAYNAVLYACAECSKIDGINHAEAFQTSVKIFTELRRETDPDHVTFGNMLRCSNLLPPSEQRDKFITATFQLCCDGGYVNSLVLRDLRIAASPDLWTSLTGLDPFDEGDALDVGMEKLPKDWGRQMLDRKPNPKNQHQSFRSR